jgi:hypothetical protein
LILVNGISDFSKKLFKYEAAITGIYLYIFADSTIFLIKLNILSIVGLK